MSQSQDTPGSTEQFVLGSAAFERRRRVPAWAMSVVFHLILLVVLGLTLRTVPHGTSTEPVRAAGIVLARTESGEREYFDSAVDAQTTTTDANVAEQLTDSVPAAESVPAPIGDLLPDGDVSIGAGAGNSLLFDTGKITQGTSARAGIGGQGETSVFGATGVGTKFVYVFDRSGSMDGFGGRPLKAAKHELIASLHDLERTHQFQIIFYNERPRVFNPEASSSPGLVWGDELGKRSAERFVQSVTADGATQHMDALRMALNLRPDVIFFLTDADEPQMTQSELSRITRLNRGSTIHTIEFGFGPSRGGSNFLALLARSNGGQHVYVDISKLSR